jgi:hypothetical protein
MGMSYRGHLPLKNCLVAKIVVVNDSMIERKEVEWEPVSFDNPSTACKNSLAEKMQPPSSSFLKMPWFVN